jgi:hypothetical protein
MTGELHFLRSQNDLLEVLVNVMQSTNAIIRLINKAKLNPIDNSTEWILHLEKVIFKLLLQIKHICSILQSKDPVCIPGICLSMECIAVILTKTIIFLINLRKEYKEEIVIDIIGQVGFYNEQ